MISKKSTLSNILPLVILLVCAGMVIFFRFPEIPQNLSFDEVEFAHLALSLENTPYAPYSPLATGHATLYFYILLASLKTFGINAFALRFPAACFGVLSVGMIWLLMKQVFQHLPMPALPIMRKNAWLLPFILGFVFLSLRWYFNFARFSFEATFLLFLELTSIYSFFHYKEKGSLRWLALSGAMAGLAFNSYTPGRIFFLLIVFFLLYEIGKNRPIRSRLAVPFLTFIVPCIIMITPLSLYLMVQPDIRIDQLSYMNNTEIPVSEKLGYFGENVVKTGGMFFVQGDLNGRHNYPGKPALNILIAGLFLGGVIRALTRINTYHHAFFLSYCAIALIPALFTYPAENPHMLRTFTVLPAVIYFSGLIIHYLLTKIPTRTMLIIITILIGISTLYELRTYFIYQTMVFPEAFELKKPLQNHIPSSLLL